MLSVHYESLVKQLHTRMASAGVPGAGAAVIRGGELEPPICLGLEEAGNARNVHPDSLFHACSMSKMVTALGVLRMVQDGVLDLHEDVNSYLKSWRIPDSPLTKNRSVTLSALLSHQGGFIDPDGSFDRLEEQALPPAPSDLLRGTTRYHAEPAQVQYEPGTQFHYSDTGYTVIELLIEDVTGEPFTAAIDRLVLAPLGLRHSILWNGHPRSRMAKTASLTAGHDNLGHTVDGTRAHYPNLSGAGLWTTPSEMVAIAIDVMNAWSGRPSFLLSQELVRLMLTGSGTAPFAGLGVFLEQSGGEPCFVSKGWGIGYQCMLVAYPRLESGIVVMTNQEPGKPQEEAFSGDAIRTLAREYGWPGI